MQIEAKCKLDYEAIKALQQVAAYRGADPKKRFIIGCILQGMVLLFGVFFLLLDDPIGYTYLFLGLVLFLLSCYTLFWLPKLQYKALKKLQDADNTYFFGDDSLRVITEGEEYRGESEMKYTILVKAYESSRYFFLFKTGNQVFAVDKATVTGGSAEEIRSKLQPLLGKNYKICKY